MSFLTCRSRHVHASPMTTSAATHMAGYLAPVPDEIDAVDLPVEGALPPELAGRYFRNGPNPRPGDQPAHWFLGRGMLHGVRLVDGRAEWYRNRWVDAEGEPNTSVLEHADRLFALVEG